MNKKMTVICRQNPPPLKYVVNISRNSEADASEFQKDTEEMSIVNKR